jgi:hypothetical protein
MIDVQFSFSGSAKLRDLGDGWSLYWVDDPDPGINIIAVWDEAAKIVAATEHEQTITIVDANGEAQTKPLDRDELIDMLGLTDEYIAHKVLNDFGIRVPDEKVLPLVIDFLDTPIVARIHMDRGKYTLNRVGNTWMLSHTDYYNDEVVNIVFREDTVYATVTHEKKVISLALTRNNVDVERYCECDEE